jgi:GxxExxY protein
MLNTTTPLTDAEERIVAQTIGCGIAVHRELGPGFRETIYHQAFRLELESRGLRFESEKKILVQYRQWSLPGQQIDLIVGGVVLVELKAVPRLKPLHRRQVTSYLRTTGLKVGLLLNFDARTLKEGMHRLVC